MKYLYLIQLPTGEGEGGIPLDKYVFNTEAHPVSVFPQGWMEGLKGTEIAGPR